MPPITAIITKSPDWLLLGNIGQNRTEPLVLDNRGLIDLRPFVEGAVGQIDAIVPDRQPSAPQTLARNVLVAWNGSTEQARTNAFALPLLRLADKVTVLTVEGGTTPGPSGDEAARHRRRNGIKAAALTAKPGARTSGEVILDHAASLGCDLLVKGACTQSRLRQMIFGGATRHILANATLPVLMAH